MKYNITFIFCSFILIVLFGCNKTLINESEDFRTFIEDFFLSNEFQIQRTIFPFEYTFYDPSANVGEDIITKYITKDEWVKLDDAGYLITEYFIQIYDNFEQKLQNSSKRVLSFEGNQTGVNVSLFFILQDGKWFLIKKEDFST